VNDSRSSERRSRELREAYEAPGVADHYASGRWGDSGHARRTDRRERSLLRAFLRRIGGCTRILDVPCGAGRMARLLAESGGFGCQVIGIDIAAPMLSAARSRHPLSESGPWLLQASAANLPMLSESVDLVLCFRLLHHFPLPAERREVLAECARVSRRWVIVSYFDSASLQAWRNRLRRRPSRRFVESGRAFAAEAAAAGLDIVQRRWVARAWSEQVLALLEKRR